jgi:hypothetical protein
MLIDQAFPTVGCQAGIVVCMHGVYGLGMLGRTTTVPTYLIQTLRWACVI